MSPFWLTSRIFPEARGASCIAVGLITAMATKTPTDRGQHLLRLAARQHGVVSRDQMHALGWSDSAISHAINTGRLHRVFRGVYALATPEIGKQGRLGAAVLACGRGAVISRSLNTLFLRPPGHQFQSPRILIVAGTRRTRIMVASTKTATASPKPTALVVVMPVKANAPVTTTTMAAAEVIMPAVATRPWATLAVFDSPCS